MAAEDLTSPDITPPPSGLLGVPALAEAEAVAVAGPLAIVLTGEEIERCYAEERGAAQRIHLGMDLVFAAKRLLGFLRTIDSLPCLHTGPAVIRAIRRYQKFWMPLVADSLKFDALLNVDTMGKSFLPPLDVQWIWHCHRLNPVAYRRYCMSTFGRIIDCPLFPDGASENLAQERCKRLWSIVYHKEPYDMLSTFYKFNGSASGSGQVCPVDDTDGLEELVASVAKQTRFFYYVSQPYMWEESFLQTATERYKWFLHLLYKSKGKIRCIPTFDIDLIWHAHQLAPVTYVKDTKALLECIADYDEDSYYERGFKMGHGFEDTAKLWESTFGIAYERAGSLYHNIRPVNMPLPAVTDACTKSALYEKAPTILPWDFCVVDHNPTKYPVLTPRHVLQLCVLIKCVTNTAPIGRENANLFVRLRRLDTSTALKLETPVVPAFTQDSQWQQLWVLQCETKTKGVLLELRYHVDGCLSTFQKTKRIGGAKLSWQELQKAPMLSHEIVLPLQAKRSNSVERQQQPQQLRLHVSITPPVQAAYLLKSVPDRVTDDQGAMLSSTILRTRRNREAQSGRWISRTVLSHAGKESFVIRIRAAKGSWRKSGDRPVGVDWNERVINIHLGGWNYVANSVGIAPEKIVGSASPLAHELEQYKLSWALSTGDTLIISRDCKDPNWERHLEFTLKISGRRAGLARLVNGRKQQYEVPGASAQEDEGFVTLIRYGPQTPQGKATALFNFKVSAMEVVPEEDVVLVLLLCTATMRSIADFGGLSAGNEYTRRRSKEYFPGCKDWGSVVLESATPCQSHLAHWHWNGGHTADDAEDGDGEAHPGQVVGASESDTQAVDWSDSEHSLMAPSPPPPEAAAMGFYAPTRAELKQRAGGSMQIFTHIDQGRRPISMP